MKKSIFLLGCLALAWASCHSPEERAAMKASADSAAKAGTTVSAPHETEAAPAVEAAAPVKTDTVAKEIAPKTDAPVVAATEVKPPAEKAAALPGEGLVKKSDCLACHSVAQKIVGPAYKNVAAKYAATDENIEMLADKIIAGGSGVWGPIPMSPHPAIAKADAKEMVKYILSLKK